MRDKDEILKQVESQKKSFLLTKERLIRRFIRGLIRISKAYSEAEMFKGHCRLDQWVHDKLKKELKKFHGLKSVAHKRESREVQKLLYQMENDLIQLERCLEVGYRVYLESWDRVAEVYRHELEQETFNEDEKRNDQEEEDEDENQ